MKVTNKQRFEKIAVGAIYCIAICIVLLGAFSYVRNTVIIDEKDEILEYGESFHDNTTATILGGIDVTQFLKVTGTIDSEVLGKQKITYSFLGKKAEKTVTVYDATPPTISLAGDLICEVEDSIDNFVDPGYFVSDNADKNILDSVYTEVNQIKYNEYLITYIAQDFYGNEAMATRRIRIVPSEENSKGTIYLTFDDGPSTLTPHFLEVLREYGVKATFFIVEFQPKKDGWKADIIEQAIADGHTIALHGSSHEYSEIYSSVENTVNSFTAENQFLLDNFGIDTKIMRFPGGSSNTISKRYCKGVMTEASKILTEQGYSYFDWNVDSNDAGSDVGSSNKIYDNVITTVMNGRENVVLMHDSGNHSATLEALPKIIEALQKENYIFRAITENTTEVRHKINN